GDPLHHRHFHYRYATALRRAEPDHQWRRSLGFDAHPVALYLQSQLPLHAKLRLRRHRLLCDRGAGGHSHLHPVPGRTGAPLMSNPLALIGRAATYLLLLFAAFVSVFPFFWMAVSATNTSADIIKGKS